jgi:hypothetical protein
MKVRVLRPALEDLARGREFYNQQQAGVGDYFCDTLFSEIDSLVLYAGIHRVQFGYHRLPGALMVGPTRPNENLRYRLRAFQRLRPQCGRSAF